MNLLKKGPEIKLSELKVPSAFTDLYHDLRDRHLLPLLAVLAIAIVAVPIALSQTSGSSGSRAGGGIALAAPSVATSRSDQLVVAKAAPGLHPYRRRLGYLHAKDPFKQQYAKAESTSSAISSTTSGASESGSSSTSASSSEAGSTPVTSASRQAGGESATTTSHPTYFSYAIDVRVISGGPQTGAASPSKSKPLMRRNLPELTALPSRREPAAIFMGVTQDGKKALLTLSSDIDSAFGEGRCLLGAQTCQLMALEPGLPETFVYGRQNRTFKIELLKVHLVASKLHSVTGASKSGH